MSALSLKNIVPERTGKMNAYNEMLHCIEWVLRTKSSYQVAKDLGINNRTANRYQNGETPIENMTLKTAKAFYNYYKGEFEMENKINEIISAVEEGKMDLVQDWTFEEREYTDGASDVYVEQDVEGYEDIALLFAEKDHFQELRNEIYREEKTQDDLHDLVADTSGLDDQFNYDKVVGYRVEGGAIVWL